MSTILVTGGAGYIGSHTVVELLSNGFDVVILDNFCNSSPLAVDRIEQISQRRPMLVTGDMRDIELLDKLFADYNIAAVVHFAGLKAVGESVEQPWRYYDNNVSGTIALLGAMQRNGCHRIVFSSSATVYGDPASVPITEDFPLGPTNPYGETKLMIEDILRDISHAEPEWGISLLRYFNPVAAHPSGLIGEDPSGIPNNLMPYVAQVAVGKLAQLTVFGDDYSTPDGTGVRDYVHVVDLAKAHVQALRALVGKTGCTAYNIGTGSGVSVLEMIAAFEAASGASISYVIGPRRSGDIASCYANADLAAQELDWQAEAGLEEMMRDHWNWQVNNPHGYAQS